MSISLQVSTVRSEDLSIDNSQLIDQQQASPRNSAYLSPRKQPKSLLPALHEQHTASTHASSGDSVFNNVEETEHPGWAYYDNSSARHAHNDPTRRVSNIGSGNRYHRPLSSPKHATPSAPSVVEVGRHQHQEKRNHLQASRGSTIEESLGIDYARFDEEPEEMAAWVIHAALIGFFSLVCLSLVLSFVVIHNYGFLTLLFLGLLVGFCVGLAIFIDRTVLQKNEKLKPIRNKIASAVTAAKNAIHEEICLFKNEWRDYHLLLTNGEHDIDPDHDVTTAPTRNKKKKSVMFKMIKPFVVAKKKIFKRKQQRPQSKASLSTEVATA